MGSRGWVGVALVRIASVYLLVGLVLGMAMAMAEDFRLVSVHSHLLLLGWATLALTGIVHLVLPRRADTWLAAAHFWLHNLGLPVMMLSLAAVHLGEPRAEPLVGLGSILVIAGLASFTVNLFGGAKAGGDSRPVPGRSASEP